MDQGYRGNNGVNDFMEENMALMRESISRAETLIQQVKEVINELVGDNGLTPEMVRLKVEERRNDRVMNIYNAILKCLYEVEELDGKIILFKGFDCGKPVVELRPLEVTREVGETTYPCSDGEYAMLMQKLKKAEIFCMESYEDDWHFLNISIN